MAEWTIAPALKAGGRKARGFESLPFRWRGFGRRANGAGSVYFDQANECYFATWQDSDGKRRKVRGKTQGDAERRRAAAIEEHEAATRARDSPVHASDHRPRARRVVARQRGPTPNAPVVGRHRR